MVRLKTLSELIGCELREGKEFNQCPNCGGTHTITEEALKAEAIQWIKALDAPHDALSKIGDHNINYWLDTPNWIQEFFGIKTEELK